MSAICGILQLDSYKVNPGFLVRLIQSQSFTDSDLKGSWSEGRIGLGYIDSASPGGEDSQLAPGVYSSGNRVLVHDARVYNAQGLMRLLYPGGTIESGVSTAQLLHDAYLKWGEDCCRHIMGDWAFALWDKEKEELFLARDHHGNRGLYYYADGSRLVFSSCIKGLLSLPFYSPEPCIDKVVKVITSWGVHDGSTCYKGIKRLMPAHSLKAGKLVDAPVRYWSPGLQDPLFFKSDQDYVDAFLELYRDAVVGRLAGSLPVASTLSGGLDSGSVSAIAADFLKQQGKELRSYTSVPLHDTGGLISAKRFGNEWPYARATASFSGNIDAVALDARGVSPLEGILTMLEVHDEPGHAAGNHFWISDLLRTSAHDGYRVLLTGQGGNATISWPTPGFRRLSTRERTRGLDLHTLSGWIALTRVLAKSTIPTAWLSAMQSILQNPEPWLTYSAINPGYSRSMNLGRAMREEGHDPFFRQAKDSREARLNILRPGQSIGGALWDQNGRWFGIEVRDPTVDPRLIEFCLGIPDDQFARGDQDRFLIRRAMKGIMPEEVLSNSARGRQSADIALRVRDDRENMIGAMNKLGQSPLARQILDLPRMRQILDSTTGTITPSVTNQVSSILMRGLMAGLFLTRFD